MRLLLRLPAMLCLLLLAACATQREQDKLLDATLDQYAATIRWGNVDDALSFLAPDAPRPSAFEIERLKQLQIAGYREQPPVLLSPTEIEQVAQIDFVNRHTQEGKSAIERMRWRYDATAQRWWLVSGLPKLQSQ
ncbi:MAG: hypothetical protein IPO95_12125 [Rhodanobacteraceae bacterium]|nr:hypothetical protein [Rhodanobacteraceae bacterium]MBL0039831.1 hypothetical protein [Xanthomonadales bacterium]MBP6079012.1 hypothetical protein [Xanthomonadales bacterium]MBP7622357.1 hypothetical protein [Xanthomonadales bacterium]